MPPPDYLPAHCLEAHKKGRTHAGLRVVSAPEYLCILSHDTRVFRLVVRRIKATAAANPAERATKMLGLVPCVDDAPL